jgi:hypothetical protein
LIGHAAIGHRPADHLNSDAGVHCCRRSTMA